MTAPMGTSPASAARRASASAACMPSRAEIMLRSAPALRGELAMSQHGRPKLREGDFQIALILGRKKLTAKNLWKRKIYLGGWVGCVPPSAEGIPRWREVRLRC